MTITSVGYAGTVDDAQWALMIGRVGGSFWGVDGFGDFRVTAATGTRTVQVAAGRAWGMGVLDTSNAVETMALASVPSGTRWDMVVLRRDWATKTSVIAVVAGGSSKVLPSRNQTAGAIDDQPLALVRVIAGSSAIQEIVDLRCASSNGGVVVAWDDLVLSYLTQMGTAIRIGDVTWSRVTNSSGSAIWVSDDTTDTGWVNVPRSANWAAVSGYPLQARKIGQLVEVRGATNAQSRATLASIAVLPAAFRPARSVPLGASVTALGSKLELFCDSAGKIFNSSGYRDGGMPVGDVVMIQGMFFRG